VNLSTGGKVLLGAATLWPFAYMIFFFLFVLSRMFTAGMGGSMGGPSGPGGAFLTVFAMHFLTMLIMLGLTVFYIVYVFRSDRVAQDKKALWAVVIFLGNMIAMPIFFYLYIWRDPEIPPAGAPAETRDGS